MTKTMNGWRGSLGNLMLIGSLVGIAILMAVAFQVASQWDAADEQMRAASDARNTAIRQDSMTRSAQDFLARMAKDSESTRIVRIRIEDGVEFSVGTREARTLSFPAMVDGNNCTITVSAYGDISAEAIFMRPETLTCNGQARSVRGEIRSFNGQILDAHVIVNRKWLGQPQISLHLPPLTTAQAWLKD